MASSRPTTRADQKRALAEARRFVDRHLGDRDLDLDVVAQQLHVSPRRLQRAYAANATSFSADLFERRMQLARKLLERGASARQVADNVGYGSGAALAKAVRRRYGKTPHELREPQRAARSAPDPGATLRAKK